MKKIMNAAIDSQPETSPSNVALSDNSLSSNDIPDFPAPVNIPKDVWDRCLVKVKSLHDSPTSMSTVPGGNARSKFVAWSRNPDSPIKVQAGKFSGKYMCNKAKCPKFAGL